jgi:hypothetical protein
MSQVLHQGTVRFVEVKFLFHASVTGIQEALALGSMYSLVDDGLNAYTHGALNVYKYEGENALVVIKANSIISVVAMVPFREQVEGGRPFFLVEKFALGVLDTGDTVE